jgi:hypothetical protein
MGWEKGLRVPRGRLRTLDSTLSGLHVSVHVRGAQSLVLNFTYKRSRVVRLTGPSHPTRFGKGAQRLYADVADGHRNQSNDEGYRPPRADLIISATSISAALVPFTSLPAAVRA